MATVDIAADIKKAHKTWQFPTFIADEFSSKKNKYCVCVFVINEGEKVQKQLEKMKTYTSDIDVIVADGGSTDGSLEPDFLKKQKVRTLLTKKGPGKLSAQMRMAFAYALHEGYEGIVVVDGNGKDDITAIPQFVKLLGEGYDHIQGSRFIPGGKAINTPLSREIGLHLIHAPLISIASRKRHTDTTNVFRGYSAKLLRDEQIAPMRDVFMTYELHYHLAIESSRNKKKFKTTETPVTRAYPKKGKTPTKISPIKGNAHVMKVLLKAVAGHYRKK
jgi:dolichol-phosphate mannosyltransferase